MQIKEDITIKLSKEDLHYIIVDALKKEGYIVQSVNFNIEEKCEGFPEVYHKVFTGANCKVVRDIEGRK